MTIWNWKAALLSAVYRAPVFFFTTLNAGWRSAMSAMFVEGIFRAATSGFYGAFTQALRNVKPAWVPVMVLGVVAPVVLQTFEIAFHYVASTPNLRKGAIVSTIITSVAALFNLFAMRRGTFLTGEEGRSLGDDLRRLPLVILDFILMPFMIWRKGQSVKD